MSMTPALIAVRHIQLPEVQLAANANIWRLPQMVGTPEVIPPKSGRYLPIKAQMSLQSQTNPVQTTPHLESALAIRTRLQLLLKMVPTMKVVTIMQPGLPVHMQGVPRVIGICPLQQS
jgi:hypothetical protein